MTDKEYILTSFNKWNNKELNDAELINELLMFQSNFRNCELWFRFYRGDPLATTINNIERDLANSVNRNYMVECIQTLKGDTEYFEVNFDYFT